MKIQISCVCIVTIFTVPVLQLGWTPLHYASMKGNVDLVQLLADSGANCNIPDSVSVFLSSKYKFIVIVKMVMSLFFVLQIYVYSIGITSN